MSSYILKSSEDGVTLPIHDTFITASHNNAIIMLKSEGDQYANMCSD